MGKKEENKKYFVFFPSLQTREPDEFSSEVVIGEEEGDILLKGYSLAPKHASILVDEGIFSIIDHGSEAGSFIGKTQLEPNKKYIIDPKDKLRLGDLEVAVGTSADMEVEVTKLIKKKSKGPSLFTKLKAKLPPKKVKEEVLSGRNLNPSKAVAGKLKKKPKTKKLKATGRPKVVSQLGLVPRILAISIDGLIACIPVLLLGINLFEYTSEITKVLKFLETELTTIIGNEFNLSKYFTYLYKDQVLKGIAIYTYFSGVCILTSLIFGRTLGQFSIGINSTDSFLRKRIKGFFREIFSFILTPFLIFDLGVLLGKRSLKEKFSFSALDGKSFLTTSMLYLLSLLLWGGILIATPLQTGFKFAPSYKVNGEYKYSQNTDKFLFGSKSLKFSIRNKKVMRALPFVSLKLSQGKRKAKGNIVLFKKGQKVEIQKTKEINLIKLAQSYAKSNPLLEFTHPAIFEVARSVGNSNKSFNVKVTNQKAFNTELASLFRLSFESFNLGGIPEILQAKAFPYSLKAFRDNVMGLYEEKILSSRFTTLNGTSGLFTSHKMGKKKTYKFLVLAGSKGVLYTMSEDLSSKTFTSITSNIAFEDKLSISNKGHALESLDFLGKETRKHLERVYQAYYNELKLSIIRKDDELRADLIKKARQYLKYKENKKREVKRFILKMSELIVAGKSKKKKFFGIK